MSQRPQNRFNFVCSDSPGGAPLPCRVASWLPASRYSSARYFSEWNIVIRNLVCNLHMKIRITFRRMLCHLDASERAQHICLFFISQLFSAFLFTGKQNNMTKNKYHSFELRDARAKESFLLREGGVRVAVKDGAQEETYASSS